MLSLAYDNDAAHMAWASERLGRAGMSWPADTVTIGVVKGDETVCAVLFNLFLEKTCCAHIVSDRSRAWATRGILAAFFAYPFVQCGLNRITLPAPSSKKDAIVFAVRLGFEFEGRLANVYENGDDEILLGMQRDKCPWLPRNPFGA